MPANASQKRRRLDFSHTFHLSLDDFQHAQTSVAVIDRVSADCRRTYPQEYHIAQPAPSFFEPLEFNDSVYDSPWDLEGQDPEVVQAAQPKKRYASSVRINSFFRIRFNCDCFQDDQLYEWKPYRAEYLDQMLFLDGFRGFSRDRCPTCTEPSNDCPPLYRCQDCFIGQPVCKSCCLSGHLQHPLHVIEVFFFFCSQSGLITFNFHIFHSAGMATFSNALLSKLWAFEFSWATPLTLLAPIPDRAPKNSMFFTLTASMKSR